MPFAALAVPLIKIGASVALKFISNALTPKPKIESGKVDDGNFSQGPTIGKPLIEIYGGAAGTPTATDRTGFRIEANFIWSRPIQERKRRRGGGKGQPRVTEFTYFGTFAVMLGRGPLRLRKIFLNELLAYDRYAADTGATGVVDTGSVVTGTLKLGGGQFAWYSGTDSQTPDPTIQSFEGVGRTPAYVGRSYITFANLGLEKFGNSIPRVICEVESAEIFSVEQICADLARRSGLLSSEYDFTALAGINSRGVTRQDRAAARATLDVLASVHNFYLVDSGAQITARLFGTESITSIPAKELGVRDGDAPIELLEVEAADQRKLPRRLEVKFVDGARENEINQAAAMRYDTPSDGESELSLPVNLTADDARRLAERELFRTHLEADRFTASLSDRYALLSPGEIVAVTDGDDFIHQLRIDRKTFQLPGIVTLECVRTSVATRTQPGFQDDETSPGETTVPPVAYDLSPTRIEFANLPNLDPNGANPIYVFTAPENPAADWPGALVEVDRGGGFVTAITLSGGATIGDARTALASASGIDTTNTLTVDFPVSVTLVTATADEIAAGKNNLLVGQEVVGFRARTPVSGAASGFQRWNLTTLHRGLYRTENASGAHVLGERAILLQNDAIETILPPPSDRDQARDYRAITAGQTSEEATEAAHTWRAGATAFVAFATGTETLRAQWTAGSSATAQKLLYRLVGAASFTEISLGAAATTADVAGLEPGATYEVRLEQVISLQVYATPSAFATQPLVVQEELYVDADGAFYVNPDDEIYAR